MSFRLTTVPATCQKLVEYCLGELHLTWCISYVEDIIVLVKLQKNTLQNSMLYLIY